MPSIEGHARPGDYADTRQTALRRRGRGSGAFVGAMAEAAGEVPVPEAAGRLRVLLVICGPGTAHLPALHTRHPNQAPAAFPPRRTTLARGPPSPAASTPPATRRTQPPPASRHRHTPDTDHRPRPSLTSTPRHRRQPPSHHQPHRTSTPRRMHDKHRTQHIPGPGHRRPGIARPPPPPPSMCHLGTREHQSHMACTLGPGRLASSRPQWGDDD